MSSRKVLEARYPRAFSPRVRSDGAGFIAQRGVLKPGASSAILKNGAWRCQKDAARGERAFIWSGTGGTLTECPNVSHTTFLSEL